MLVQCHNDHHTSKQHKDKKQSEVTKAWHRIQSNSNKNFRPNYTGEATKVYVELAIMKFGGLNDRDMTFTMDISLTQIWNDYRLQHNFSEPLIPLIGMSMPSDMIWIPDSVIINSIYSQIHFVTSSNSALYIYPNGTVFLEIRATVRSMCEMNFKNFPLDVQYCHVGIESYAYPANHIVYEWNSKSSESASIRNKEMSKFHVEIVGKYQTFVVYSLGNFSLVQVEFKFSRRVQYTFFQIFFPTISIVAVSWTSFYIHKNCVSSRVNFGVTTLLTLSFIWSEVNFGLPLVSYIKAIDIYFLVSFTFILLSLLEYTFVMNTDTRIKKDKKLDNDRKLSVTSRRVLQPSSNGLLIDRKISKDEPDSSRFITALDPHTAARKKIFQLVQEEDIENEVIELNNRGRVMSYVYSTEDKLKDREVIKPRIRKFDTNQHHKSTLLDRASRILFPIAFFSFNVYFFIVYSKASYNQKPKLNHH